MVYAFAILRTGWDEYWGEDRYYHNPYLSPDLAQRFLELKFINADSVTTPTGEAHRILMGDGAVLVENPANLKQLKAGKVYEFAFLLLKIAPGDGSPVRAIAWE